MTDIFRYLKRGSGANSSNNMGFSSFLPLIWGHPHYPFDLDLTDSAVVVVDTM